MVRFFLRGRELAQALDSTDFEVDLSETDPDLMLARTDLVHVLEAQTGHLDLHGLRRRHLTAGCRVVRTDELVNVFEA